MEVIFSNEWLSVGLCQVRTARFFKYVLIDPSSSIDRSVRTPNRPVGGGKLGFIGMPKVYWAAVPFGELIGESKIERYVEEAWVSLNGHTSCQIAPLSPGDLGPPIAVMEIEFSPWAYRGRNQKRY